MYKTLVLLSLAFLPSAALAELTTWMIDMSSHNAAVKVERNLTFQDSGYQIEMIFHRATIGTYRPPNDPGDSYFSRRAREINDANLHFGAYHVAYPSSDAQTQASGFVKAIQDACVPNQKVVLALDWEHVCVKWEDPKRKNKCAQEGLVPPSFVVDFSDRIAELTGKRPLIYTSTRALREFGGFFKGNASVRERVAGMPLWLARYHSSDGGLNFPRPSEFYPWHDWLFWQFAEGKGVGPTRRISLRVQSQPIDTNFFNGPRSAVATFVSEYAWTCTR